MSKPVWQQLGLSDSEYQLIREKMGREPNFLELSLFSAMWSEHCGYKNSKPLFSYFPTSGPRVLQGPGENAGIVDIGDGLAITMKVESHNHPSALAPFQGAATGAGGIIRDILAVGSEPVALLNSLHFGPIEANRRNRYLLREVVHGIGEYGNCVGIPTLGGEVKFGDVYSGNPLVNAMCVGMLKIEDIKKAVATGPGNSVMIVGNWTGRDGVGGAAFASKELHDESDEERSAVQVGDPFMEKLLIEACLEAFKQDYVIGVQDLGAAGLISSTSETADKADTGIVIDVAKVPQRENDMEPWQIMLSESQERMLLIVEKGSEGLVNEIFHRWDLHAVVIGQVTDDGILRVVVDGNEVGNVPVAALNEPPMYRREGIVPLHMREAESVDSDALAPITDHNNTLLQMLASPNIASKRWVYQQYDQQVKTNTVTPPGEDSGVFRIKGTDKAIAVTMDSNGHYGHIDAYHAGKIIVAEACRNLVSKGARPIAVTDGLNFGNPEKLDVYWQLEASIRGISEACKSFAVPVISGNASLYNEAPEGAIYPTPIIGMVGLIEAVERVPRGYFTAPGDHVYVLGKTRAELGASEFLRHIHGQRQGPLPEIDLALETRHQEALYCICLQMNCSVPCTISVMAALPLPWPK
jgi:phosphoribosylformylglycinamidine synthase II